MDEETKRYLELLEDKWAKLRESDALAVELRHADLSQRLEGFPQQFATKEEMKSAAEGVAKLEKDAVTREIYEQQSKALSELVTKLDKEKLTEAVFQTFVENYQRTAENDATERRAIAAALAASGERRAGAAGTWKLQASIIGAAVAFVSIIVLIANNAISFH